MHLRPADQRHAHGRSGIAAGTAATAAADSAVSAIATFAAVVSIAAASGPCATTARPTSITADAAWTAIATTPGDYARLIQGERRSAGGHQYERRTALLPTGCRSATTATGAAATSF